jgi:hypothetical protein
MQQPIPRLDRLCKLYQRDRTPQRYCLTWQISSLVRLPKDKTMKLDLSNMLISTAATVIFLDRDALALVATMPGEALRLALLASMLRESSR